LLNFFIILLFFFFILIRYSLKTSRKHSF